MALQLINVGTTSNDGTGDTLRTAGQKMNANASELFALVADTQGALGEKVETDALANFETTAQLDTRDTGNRARANHTGTQAISTVMGLQTALDAKLEAGALTGLMASDVDQYTAIAALILNDGAQDSAIASFETTAQLDTRDSANRSRANHTGTQAAATISDFSATAAAAAPVQSVAGRSGAVVLAEADVGLANVDNTSDAAKPISTATQTALDAKAPLTAAQATTTYAATVDLDLSALNGSLRTITLTGNLTLTSSNRAAARSVTLRLICDATLRTLTFPAGWVFLGAKPANIAASKIGVLSLTFFGTADADCVAAWGVQS